VTKTASPIIETHRLNDADAGELERQTGCIVADISGLPGPIDQVSGVSYDRGRKLAAELSDRHADRVFGVFKIACVCHKERPDQEPQP